MSRGRKVIAPFKPYEGRKFNGRHMRMTHDQLQDKAFISLRFSSQVLYLYMKDWACGDVDFRYSWRLANKIIKSSRTYQSAKKELIDKGFIICTRTGKCLGEPNHYKFVSDWSKK